MSRSDRKHRFVPGLLALLGCLLTNVALADPPDRVARLNYIHGDVSFTPAGDDRWSEASLNRPLVTGDKLYTDRDARAELDLGTAKLRLNENTGFSFLNLDDKTAQIELTEGTVNLHVRRLYQGQSYEVDTPTVAFVVNEPGEYRIDAGRRNDASQITVFNGSGTVYGENGTSYRVDDKQSYRFADPSLRNPEVMDLPRPDEFDDWSFARDDRERRSATRRYVSEDVVGASDLDEYGDWDGVPDYGNVWFPSHVASDWAPYRSGHWAWIDPWGWTWVDDEPWGFAPFHYGRWVYVRERWGWVPGPVAVRPVYAPALVAFVGGPHWSVGISLGDGPVGWCPLGPGDVYVPPYRVSRDYFRQVNVTNTTIINNTHITNIYNNYAAGQAPNNVHYTYRDNPAAVTAVSRDTFAQAQPVGERRLHFGRGQLQRAQVLPAVAIAPTAASLMPANAHAAPRPPKEAFDRQVIAHHTPAPVAPPLDARLRAIQHNNGRPLGNRQLRQLAMQERPATAPNVQVLDKKELRKPLPLTADTAPAPGQAQDTATRARAGLFGRGGRHPEPAYLSQTQSAPPESRAPAARPPEPPRESAPRQAQALPSARFAPHAQRNASVPATAASPQDLRGTPHDQRTRGPRDRYDRNAAAAQRPGADTAAPIERNSQALPSSRFFNHGRTVESPHPAQRDNTNIVIGPSSAAREQSQAPAPVQSDRPDQRVLRADRPRYQRATPNEVPAPEYHPAPRVMRVPEAPRPAPEIREAPRAAPPPHREPPAAAAAPRELPARPALHEPPPAATNRAPPQPERAPHRGQAARRAREDQRDNPPSQ